MDALDSVKSEASAPKCHPEDSIALSDHDSDNLSDSGSSASNKNKPTDDRDIPGTGPNDMPMLGDAGRFRDHKTGVKSVIADAFSYEAARREIAKRRVARKGSSYSELPVVPASTPLGKSSDHESSEEDEEEFVRTWRKNRLEELKAGKVQTRRRSPSKRRYGRVEPVDAAGYLDAVERVGSDTVVVVLIYSDESSESSFVSDCFNTLSRRYETTRFVKLHHEDAEMESAVVPAVLAYKGGELFANIMRIVDEIPSNRSLSTESLELVLRRANVLHKD